MRTTMAASVALAIVAFAAGFATGRPSIGSGVAVGLVLGAFNGHALAALMQRDVPFVGASLLRMAAFSGAGIFLAILVGSAPWAALLGVAGAQVVMTAAAVRQGLRA